MTDGGSSPGEAVHDYFAYALDLDPARMRDRCPGATARRPAVLPDWRLVFDKATNDWDGSAAANVEPTQGGAVEGVLYTLAHADLLRLDAFQGHPRHYTRRLLVVVESAGLRTPAWVYTATPEYRRNGLRPRRAYLEGILAGTDLFSPAYRARLGAVATFD